MVDVKESIFNKEKDMKGEYEHFDIWPILEEVEDSNMAQNMFYKEAEANDALINQVRSLKSFDFNLNLGVKW